ncbi:MAG TPA: methyltransferase domain-containing protein [Tepidisphaeraceae bacterium]|jgi:cyclopropane fatty-acyl-phospholipid synthase-like methyltransferase
MSAELANPAVVESDPAARKISGKALTKSVLTRVLHPAHLFQAMRLQINRKKNRHAHQDAQLELYSQILPSEFLHLGYFDDPDRRPEDISLADIVQAQNRYAELLLEQGAASGKPTLDVGCGMGGLTRMLLERGDEPTALTPDRLQAAHLRKTLPEVPLIHSKFERISPADYAQRFGTIYTSESLQYLKLDLSLPIMKQILAPGGKWIACDFFHVCQSKDKSLHHWDDFARKLTEHGWRITFQRDITPHILPTLAFVHMWATRIGIPLMQFSFLRLRRKQPGLHHLLSNLFDSLLNVANSNIELIDPVLFARQKRYVLAVMERA